MLPGGVHRVARYGDGVTRRAILHIGWPKTATTSLQHQLRQAWPNLAGRPWDREGGKEARLLLRGIMLGTVDGSCLDRLFASSWHEPSLPVIVSDENLVGTRRWQHGFERLDPAEVPGLVSATSWPVHVVMTLRDPAALLRSNYRYAVRGGYSRSYADYIGEERRELTAGRSPFAIRRVVEAWDRSFGKAAITVGWMERLVRDPVRFWADLAIAVGVPELARVGAVPLGHRNPTGLGALRWELALNRVLAPQTDRRRARFTRRARRFYNAHVANRLPGGPPDLGADVRERALVSAMEADLDWVCDRYGAARPW